MPRETRQAAGSWLEGPTFRGSESRGSRLGLPAAGPGSLVPLGPRVVAFVVDGVVANLLAGVPYLFGVTYGPGDRGYAVLAAFLLQEFLLVSIVGATIGKQLSGIRVVRQDGGRLTWPWVLLRTVLLGFLIPAVIWDRDGRGLHDRAAGALTVRAGTPSARPASEPVPKTEKPVKRTAAAAKHPPQRRKKRR